MAAAWLPSGHRGPVELAEANPHAKPGGHRLHIVGAKFGPPAELDLNSSPFELQEIERLPLTKEQRAALRQLIAKFDREREAAAKAKA